MWWRLVMIMIFFVLTACAPLENTDILPDVPVSSTIGTTEKCVVTFEKDMVILPIGTKYKKYTLSEVFPANTSWLHSIDIASFKILFSNQREDLDYSCFYMDKNYVYGKVGELILPLFEGFDYETIQILTGEIEVPDVREGQVIWTKKVISTCDSWGCYLDKDASYYSEGLQWWNGGFSSKMIRNISKIFPKNQGYDPFVHHWFFLSGCITKIDILPLSWNDMLTGNTRTEVNGERLPAPIISEKTEYLSWYDGPVALVTKENKDEVIVMTGEELLYRNEVYGFQVKLGKAWKGVRISETGHADFYNEEKTFHPDLIFEMLSPGDKGIWEPIVQVNILPFPVYKKTYELCKNDPSGFCAISDYEEAKRNNKNHFIIWWWFQEYDIPYEIFYPYLQCEDIVIDWSPRKDCPFPLQQLFSDWEVFDVQ